MLGSASIACKFKNWVISFIFLDYKVNWKTFSLRTMGNLLDSEFLVF